MTIVFFGTPEYVLPILEAVYKAYGKGEEGLVAVVTQPPKLVGRKQFKTFSAVDNWAYKKKIQVVTEIKDTPEAELGICAAYGKIIPNSVIEKFKYGILNIHPSLLPKYRGASPIQTAIQNGDAETGVTVLKMDNQMDHGPIISQFKEAINPDDTNESLRKRLFARSAEFLINLIPNYLNGKVQPKKQDEEKATFTRMIDKEQGFVDLIKEDPLAIERKLRSFTPWPGIYTTIKINDLEKRLKILKAHIEEEKLILDEVQLEGKNAVSWEQFKKGYPDHALTAEE